MTLDDHIAATLPTDEELADRAIREWEAACANAENEDQIVEAALEVVARCVLRGLVRDVFADTPPEPPGSGLEGGGWGFRSQTPGDGHDGLSGAQEGLAE